MDISVLLDVMKKLRHPDDGCPWDRQQDYHSLLPHTIEEAYEVADAVLRHDSDDLCDELGDLLFQVVFYARIAEELGAFDFQQVVEGIVTKLMRRHPHVFGGERIESAAQQSIAWEAHKAKERKTKSVHGGVLDGVARSLPALTRAIKLQRRAASVGFDWPDAGQVLDKVEEELGELCRELGPEADQRKIEHELGDVLLAVSNLARHVGVDPESALRLANNRFERRFQRIEALCREHGQDISQAGLDVMEAFWAQAKSEED